MTHFTPGPITGSRPRTEQVPQPRAVRFPAADKPDREPNWRERAVCANAEDVDLWFPQGSVGPWLLQIEDAKAACLTCPVIGKCAELLAHMEATLGGEVAGIWAATSEADRTSAKRRDQRAQAKVRYNEKRQAAA